MQHFVPGSPAGTGQGGDGSSGDATSSSGTGGTSSSSGQATGGGGHGGNPCASGPPSPTTAPATIDTTCFVSSFDDDFTAYDIASGPVDDGLHPGERWFNGTDQCCMSPSNGWPGVMYPTAAQSDGMPVNPYSLVPGGGLQISLQQSNDEWFSGVMTSVDKNGAGFAQTYGYFEMSAQLPPGTGTWPSFWMLSLPMGAPGGEIDVFEQLGCSPPLNPAVESIFHCTLHDWKGGTTPAAYTTQNLPDSDRRPASLRSALEQDLHGALLRRRAPVLDADAAGHDRHLVLPARRPGHRVGLDHDGDAQPVEPPHQVHPRVHGARVLSGPMARGVAPDPLDALAAHAEPVVRDRRRPPAADVEKSTTVSAPSW